MASDVWLPIAADPVKAKPFARLEAEHVRRPARISRAVIGVTEVDGPDFIETQSLEILLKGRCRNSVANVEQGRLVGVHDKSDRKSEDAAPGVTIAFLRAEPVCLFDVIPRIVDPANLG